MEAKGTVMSVNQIGDIMQPCVSPTAQGVILAQTQAETTWDIAFKAGEKKVVEWAKENDPNNKFWQSRCWQGFLKSEGIE